MWLIQAKTLVNSLLAHVTQPLIFLLTGPRWGLRFSFPWVTQAVAKFPDVTVIEFHCHG